jgi:pyruvate dehydrogenase E1 component alpha subunit
MTSTAAHRHSEVPTVPTVPGDAPASAAPVAVDLVALLREMMLIRRFEEKCVELYSATKIRGFLHLCIGEEATAVGVLSALRPEDAVISTYREHGHALARGVPASEVMAELYGKATGCSRGRGGSMHLFDAGRRFYGGNAIVGGGLPLAVGLALADAMEHRPVATAVIFGDGAFAEGEFHESANLAALWHLPVLFCCENNRYAMGTSLPREHANTDLAARAASYGMTARSVDGMDVEAVRAATDEAVAMLRRGEGPVFLELHTYRYRAHSMYDPDRYRDKAEIERFKARDPIATLTARLVETARLTSDDLAGLGAEVAAEVEAAVAAAEAGPWEPTSELTRFLMTRPEDLGDEGPVRVPPAEDEGGRP